MPTNHSPLPPVGLIGLVNNPVLAPLIVHLNVSTTSNHISYSSGFYTVDPLHPSQLILGPFQGKVACQTIAFGRGVCGTAAAKKKNIRVRDVEEFPGHIGCDGESKSEIVVPVLFDGQVSSCMWLTCQNNGAIDGIG